MVRASQQGFNTKEIPLKINQKFEIAINFTKEIPLKNVGWFQKFGGNTNVNRVSFVGWMVGW